MRTHEKFTRVNEIEAMLEKPFVNVKVEQGSTLRLRVTFHTLPLFYLRAYAQKKYAKVEIHLKAAVVSVQRDATTSNNVAPVCTGLNLFLS